MTRSLIAAALTSLALTAPTAAIAGLVTWELEGTIELASPYSVPHGFAALHADELIPQLEADGLVSGAAWSARITFDADVAPAPCEDCPNFAEFDGALISLDFVAGSFAWSSADGVAGDVVSSSSGDETSGGSDLYFTTGFPAKFTDVAALVFISADPGALFATALPIVPPDVSTLIGPTVGPSGFYTGSRIHLRSHGLVRNSDVAIFEGGAPFVPQAFAIDGRITSITPVPEPSLLVLLLAAAALLALRRARKGAFAALLAIAFGWPGVAGAGLVTWELEGTINTVSPTSIVIPFPGRPDTPNADAIVAQLEAIGVSPGAAWAGRVSFDSDTPAESCSGCDDAEFLEATKSIEFVVGGVAARTPGGAEGRASSFLAGFDPYGGPPLALAALTVGALRGV